MKNFYLKNRIIAWFIVLIVSSFVTTNLLSQHKITFNVTSGGEPVEGIYVAVEGLEIPTNASGVAIIYLSAGEYSYMVKTKGTPEVIQIGDRSIEYKDIDGNGDENEDPYDNIFVAQQELIVSADAAIDVSLNETTFKTTIAGSNAALGFYISASYYNSSGSLKSKLISIGMSDSNGDYSLPIPIQRDDRNGEILDFFDYMYYDIYGSVSNTFEPSASPVSIAAPVLNEVVFTVMAGDAAIEGITLDINGNKAKTNSSGEVTLTLADGEHTYNVYTEGTPETVIIGGETYTYLDEPGRTSGEVDPYDNIFIYEGFITVAEGNVSENIVLEAVTFNTSLSGSAASLMFDIVGTYSGSKNKTIVSVTSNESGVVSLPIPTHRNSRRGDLFEFTEYNYTYNNGVFSDVFDPFSSPVAIDIPMLYDVTFHVTSGANAVEGINVIVDDQQAKTDASGNAHLWLAAGANSYSIFSDGSPEVLTIGGNVVVFQDIDGNGNEGEDPYDNIFVFDATLDVTGEMTEEVALISTTYNTTVGGFAESVEFKVTADYTNAQEIVQTKLITELMSNQEGEISVPIPTHRTDRQGNILAFNNYQFWDSFETLSNTFNPESSPVAVALNAYSEVTFTVTANGENVSGITVAVGEAKGKTNSSGQVVLEIPNGSYTYSVYSTGSPESIAIGGEIITYSDTDGNGNEGEDPYDNIFVYDAGLIVNGNTSEDVTLPVTTFNTTVDGSAGSADFSVIGTYDFSKTKELIAISTNAEGTLTIPLPTYRDSRRGDVYEFTEYIYSASAGSVSGTFVPAADPVAIAVSGLREVTFTVTAAGEPVEGITVMTENSSAMTNASGVAVMNLPEGNIDYVVLLYGTPEVIQLGDMTFSYFDHGTYGDPNAYDNVFAIGQVNVSGNTSENVSLQTTTFNTSAGGSPSELQFSISAAYVNQGGDQKRKTIVTTSSSSAGVVEVPLPTHRTNRDFNILEFYSYTYTDLAGIVYGLFDPSDSPINIMLPGLNDITFTVTAGGLAVEGVSVGINSLTAQTNASGQAVLSLPAGEYNYSVFISGTPEVLYIGGEMITYNEDYESYLKVFDNVFVYNEPISVSGATSESVALQTTTFNTTVGGSSASATFNITADDAIGNWEVHEVTLISATTASNGSLEIPLPSHLFVVVEDGGLMVLDNYMYVSSTGDVSGAFDPGVSPVNIALPVYSDITLNLTSGGVAVQGAKISIGNISEVTNASGQVMMNLPDGDYDYTVHTFGTPETLTIGGETFTYFDIDGEGNTDTNPFDHIFKQGSLNVSGDGSEDIVLTPTTFNTLVNGSPASISFGIIAKYKNDENSVKDRLIAILSSNESGEVSLPLPIKRTSREGSIHTFYDFMYSDASEEIVGLFNPLSSPVTIELTNSHLITFTIKDEGSSSVIVGAEVSINGNVVGSTNSNGQVVVSLSDGIYNYMVGKDGYYSTESTAFIVGGEDLAINTTLLMVTSNVSTGTDDGVFKCYPNPAFDEITLQFAKTFSGIVDIYDFAGKKVKQVKVSDQDKETINVANLANGIYVLKAGSNYVKLIIK